MYFIGLIGRQLGIKDLSQGNIYVWEKEAGINLSLLDRKMTPPSTGPQLSGDVDHNINPGTESTLPLFWGNLTEYLCTTWVTRNSCLRSWWRVVLSVIICACSCIAPMYSRSWVYWSSLVSNGWNSNLSSYKRYFEQLMKLKTMLDVFSGWAFCMKKLKISNLSHASEGYLKVNDGA